MKNFDNRPAPRESSIDNGGDLETVIGNLPESALKGVKNVFLEIRDWVTDRV